MRKLLAVIVIAALAWGGYWFIGASAVEKALTAWFDQQRTAGWSAEYSTLETHGFPNRFDTTITDLDLADPRTGLGWRAPFIQILALSYRPNRIIAVLPDHHTLTTPHETIEITNGQTRGSVAFRADTALTLDHSAFVAKGMTLTSDFGWTVALDEGRFATRQAVAQENTHEIGLAVLGLVPDASVVALLDPEGALPPKVETLKLDATLAFDAPWDRFALDGVRPALTSVTVDQAQARWGDLDLRASGELDVDARGIPTGRITVTATNWRRMLDLAVTAGLVPGTLSGTLESGLQVLAGLGGDPDTIKAPLSFQNGQMALGPIPLGPAPRLAPAQ